MKKMLFLMNPYAGMRRANKNLTELLTLFNRADYEVTVYMTAAPGDGIGVVEKMAPGMDLVVCAGGDGTFNETINGMMRCGADVPIGYIPCGSTNDFASSLKLSTNVLTAAEDIIHGEPMRYDIGKFNDRFFSYVASFGAFTRASYTTPQNVKNALGHMAYIMESIQELSQIRKMHVRFELDDQVVEDDFIFGAISNSTSVGGVLTLDPRQVDMRDGKFELLLVRTPRDFSELQECILALQSQRYNCAMVTFLSASRLKVTASPDMPWTLDGEKQEGSGQAEVVNLHHAIRLVQRRK